MSFVKKKYKPQTMTVSVDVGKEMKKGFTGVSLDADDRLASNDCYYLLEDGSRTR